MFVANISSSTTEKELKKMFKEIGSVWSITMKNRYAFVEFKDSKYVRRAVKKLNGKKLEGNRIVV